jgi:hypothetical protein
MDQEEFDRRFGDTPLERAGLHGMRRNFRAVRAHESAPGVSDAKPS